MEVRSVYIIYSLEYRVSYNVIVAMIASGQAVDRPFLFAGILLSDFSGIENKLPKQKNKKSGETTSVAL